MPWSVTELREEISHHLQDPAHTLVNYDSLIDFINSAAWDASNEGWVVDVQDESLTLAATDFEYDVPAGLAYIHEIWQENTAADGTYPNFIPWHQWEIVMDASSTPAIHFSRQSFTPVVSIDLRVKGQARPTVEYGESDSVDAGMESFIRERAVAYAARNLARKGGVTAQLYAQLEQVAMEKSMELMQQQAELFRPKRYARVVPGR